MAIQNEAVDDDDDLEHFEDITEDDGNPAISVPDSRNKKAQVAEISNASDDTSEESLHEDGSATSDSDDDGVNDTDDLFGKGGFDKAVKLKSTSAPEVSNRRGPTPPPGGYNPRHREPSYCNGDRVAWWELTVFASHVHPSVAAMAQTLLSGVNIVYNGNPISDLSLGAFLDKFMEKKPKQNTWHGASEIEPAKKIDMSHQLIGAEILSLAEADVPPEDVVFHKFYMNKKDSKKSKKKKKKKTAEDEAAEDIYAVAGDEDESDNEEIENVLDSANPSAEAGSDYDYDDLDNIDNDDEDLIAEGSDEETVMRSLDDSFGEDSDGDIAEGQADDVSDFDEGTEFAEASFGEDSEDDIAEGEEDDGSDLDKRFNPGKKKKMLKRKAGKGTGTSPFASLEDYQHLMEDEAPETDAVAKKKRKSKKEKKKRKLA